MVRPKRPPTTSIKLTEPEIGKVTGDLINRRNESHSRIEREMIDDIVKKLDKAREKLAK